MREQIWQYKPGYTPYIRSDSGKYIMSLRSGDWYPADETDHHELIKIDIFELWNDKQVERALMDYHEHMFTPPLEKGHKFYVAKDISGFSVNDEVELVKLPFRTNKVVEFVSTDGEERELAFTGLGLYKNKYVERNPVQSPITEESAKRKERADKTKSLLLVN